MELSEHMPWMISGFLVAGKSFWFELAKPSVKLQGRVKLGVLQQKIPIFGSPTMPVNIEGEPDLPNIDRVGSIDLTRNQLYIDSAALPLHHIQTDGLEPVYPEMLHNRTDNVNSIREDQYLLCGPPFADHSVITEGLPSHIKRPGDFGNVD